MAGFFTDYSNNHVLDLFFSATAFAPPATLYVGLSQAISNKAGGTQEPSGGGYARVAVTNNAANWPASISGTKSNAATVTFAVPSGPWGTIQSVFVADAAAGGNVLAMADLTVPKTIGSGSTAPTVAAGALFLSHT